MAKKVKAIVKLELDAGRASPAPPVGPALANHGINITNGLCSGKRSIGCRRDFPGTEEKRSNGDCLRFYDRQCTGHVGIL